MKLPIFVVYVCDVEFNGREDKHGVVFLITIQTIARMSTFMYSLNELEGKSNRWLVWPTRQFPGLVMTAATFDKNEL